MDASIVSFPIDGSRSKGDINQPLVSIIITSYNKCDYLISAIKSALEQKYQRTEVIVIDDASTDGSQKILREVAGAAGLKIILKEKNEGVVKARNEAIGCAGGDYILTLDADDFISPDYLDLGVEYMKDHPECGICYCKAAKIYQGKLLPWKLPAFSNGQMFAQNCIFSSAIFRKADWLLVGGYDEQFNHGLEDWAFWCDILHLGRGVYQIDKVCFYYRQGSNLRTEKAGFWHEKLLFLLYQKNKWMFDDRTVISEIAKAFSEIPKFKLENEALKRKNKRLRSNLLVSWAMFLAASIWLLVLMYI